MLGNFVAPLLFKEKDNPSYDSGFIAVIACCAAACVLTVIYRYPCIWENQRRDRSGIAEGFDNAFDDVSTDFRYAYLLGSETSITGEG